MHRLGIVFTGYKRIGRFLNPVECLAVVSALFFGLVFYDRLEVLGWARIRRYMNDISVNVIIIIR